VLIFLRKASNCPNAASSRRTVTRASNGAWRPNACCAPRGVASCLCRRKRIEESAVPNKHRLPGMVRAAIVDLGELLLSARHGDFSLRQLRAQITAE